jgi:DNA ligase 1
MKKEINSLLTIEGLTGNGSQKAKQEILRENFTPSFEYVLKIAFNPFITTKLNKLEVLKESPYIAEFDPYEKFKDLTDRLFKAKAANASLREEAYELVNCIPYSYEERKMLSKVLTKKVNIGIGAKLVNKSIGREVIPDPSLMLATDEQSHIKKWNYIICEEKYDGVRIIGYYKDGKINFYTRAFKEISNIYLKKIEEGLVTLMEESGLKGEWFFDGELTDINRKSVSGKVTQMLKGKPDPSIGDNLLFNIFDLEDGETISMGRGMLPFFIRRSSLEGIFSENKCGNLVLAESFNTTDEKKINEYYKKIIDQGGEGVILKDPNHTYECKRSQSWIKMKEVNECDLVITGWYPGEGKRENFIGGFICEDKSKTVKVKVGSGFTDADLSRLSNDTDSYNGKICSVQYNVVISDKNKEWSLFLPRFVEIREDKEFPDDLRNLCK